jgi:hypothetical protein
MHVPRNAFVNFGEHGMNFEQKKIEDKKRVMKARG